MQFDKIIVPIDFSNGEEVVLEYAMALSSRFDIKINLLNVAESSDPQQVILLAVEQDGSDLLVISNEKAHLFDKVPAAAVLGVGKEAQSPPSFDRILMATDLSEVSEQSLRNVSELVRGTNANVFLVNAVEVGVEGGAEASTYLGEARLGESRMKLNAFRNEIASYGIDAETVVLEGRAADVILGVAQRRAVGLIVMAKKTELGLVTDEVFQNPKIPVLAIPVSQQAHSKFSRESNVA